MDQAWFKEVVLRGKEKLARLKLDDRVEFAYENSICSTGNSRALGNPTENLGNDSILPLVL